MKMLSNEQISENLLSDMEAYRENIKEIIIGRLMDSSNQRTYWDAWFRGAKGKDLEDAANGKIFKDKFEYELCFGVVQSINEGELFWEDREESVREFINLDKVEQMTIQYARDCKLNPRNSSDWQQIYDQASEFMEIEYNIHKDKVWGVHQKDVVERIFFDKITKIGLDIPDNYEDIVQFIYEDIMECCEPSSWGSRHVSIGLRRWMESKSI